MEHFFPVISRAARNLEPDVKISSSRRVSPLLAPRSFEKTIVQLSWRRRRSFSNALTTTITRLSFHKTLQEWT